MLLTNMVLFAVIQTVDHRHQTLDLGREITPMDKKNYGKESGKLDRKHSKSLFHP